MSTMIEFENVSRIYKSGDHELKALDNLSLKIDKGEFVVILGPSGAGKSTLVRCINLLEMPTSGTVTVLGKEMTKLSGKELRMARRKISMIFQGFHLLMQRTCLQNVCFPMELEGVNAQKAKERAMELLRVVGLEDKANSYPAQLSGGQKQRVAIARALATEPSFLLLDEPAAGMNPQESLELMNFIRQIRDEFNLTILLIEHDMKVVMGVCEHIWVLEYGKLIAEGNADAIRSNPRVIEAYLGEDVNNVED